MGAQLQLCCSGYGRDRGDGRPPGKDPRKIALQESEEAQLYEEDLTLIGEGTSLKESVAAAVERRSMRRSRAPDMAKLTSLEQHLLNVDAKCNQADTERTMSSDALRQSTRRSGISQDSRKYLRWIYSRLAKTPSLQERLAAEVKKRRTRSDGIIDLAQRSSLEQHQSNLEKIRSFSADVSAMCDQRRLSNTSESSVSGRTLRVLTLQDDLAAEVHRRTLRQSLCASKLSPENTTELSSRLRHTLRLQCGTSKLTHIRSTEAALIENGNQEGVND